MLVPIIDNESRFNIDAWPFPLLRALSLMLEKLLEKGSGISLERLQLVSCEITLVPKSEEQELVLKRETEQGHRFLKLSAQVAISDDQDALIIITYAERGAKKFFVPSFSKNFDETRVISAVGTKDVKAFLQALGHDNLFFYDEKIAELNGFPYCSVPALFLMALLMNEAAQVFKKPLISFRFGFFKSIPLHEALTIAQKDGVLFLDAGEQRAVELVCR